MAERAKAKTKRNGKAPTRTGHNSGALIGEVPDSVYERWLKKIEPAERTWKRAAELASSRKGELGAIYTAAKDDGCDIDAIKDARKKHERDHKEVVVHMRNVGRVFKIMRSPLHEQLDLFAHIEIPPEMRAEMAGEHAGAGGEPIENNPHAAGSAEFIGYEAGWTRGQSRLAEKSFGGKSDRAREARRDSAADA